jgi:ADP-ribosyl-[dinitrogen reductase] hydrolase
MKNKNRQLSMKERWEIDRKSGATFLVSSPQCEICANVIKNDAVKCLAYKEIKPNDVRRCKKECPKFKSKDPLLIKKNNKELGDLLSGIFGFCVGDALGVSV